MADDIVTTASNQAVGAQSCDTVRAVPQPLTVNEHVVLAG